MQKNKFIESLLITSALFTIVAGSYETLAMGGLGNAMHNAKNKGKEKADENIEQIVESGNFTGLTQDEYNAAVDLLTYRINQEGNRINNEEKLHDLEVYGYNQSFRSAPQLKPPGSQTEEGTPPVPQSKPPGSQTEGGIPPVPQSKPPGSQTEGGIPPVPQLKPPGSQTAPGDSSTQKKKTWAQVTGTSTKADSDANTLKRKNDTNKVVTSEHETKLVNFNEMQKVGKAKQAKQKEEDAKLANMSESERKAYFTEKKVQDEATKQKRDEKRRVDLEALRAKKAAGEIKDKPKITISRFTPGMTLTQAADKAEPIFKTQMKKLPAPSQIEEDKIFQVLNETRDQLDNFLTDYQKKNTAFDDKTRQTFFNNITKVETSSAPVSVLTKNILSPVESEAPELGENSPYAINSKAVNKADMNAQLDKKTILSEDLEKISKKDEDLKFALIKKNMSIKLLNNKGEESPVELLAGTKVTPFKAILDTNNNLTMPHGEVIIGGAINLNGYEKRKVADGGYHIVLEDGRKITNNGHLIIPGKVMLQDAKLVSYDQFNSMQPGEKIGAIEIPNKIQYINGVIWEPNLDTNDKNTILSGKIIYTPKDIKAGSASAKIEESLKKDKKDRTESNVTFSDILKNKGENSDNSAGSEERELTVKEKMALIKEKDRKAKENTKIKSLEDLKKENEQKKAAKEAAKIKVEEKKLTDDAGGTGTGTPPTPGTGTPSTPGTGTPPIPGTGTPSTPGTGTPPTPGTGTSTPGTGTPPTPGTGTPPTPGTGTSTPGTSTPPTPGTGTSTPGTSTPPTPGTSTPPTPGTGTSTPGTSTPPTPGTSTPSTPGTGTPPTPPIMNLGVSTAVDKAKLELDKAALEADEQERLAAAKRQEAARIEAERLAELARIEAARLAELARIEAARLAEVARKEQIKTQAIENVEEDIENLKASSEQLKNEGISISGSEESGCNNSNICQLLYEVTEGGDDIISLTETVNAVALNKISTESVRSSIRSINNRIASTITAAAAGDNISSKGLWISAIAGTNKSAGINSFKGKITGGSAGFDLGLNDDKTILGIAYSNINTNINVKNRSNNKFKGQNHVFSLYGSNLFNNNLIAQALISSSFGKINSSRTINRSFGTQMAKGNFNNNSLSALGSIGYQAKVNKVVTLTPKVGLNYINYHTSSFKDKGLENANGKNVRGQLTKARSNSELLAIAGLEISSDIKSSNMVIRPTAYAQVQINLNNKVQKVRAKFALHDKYFAANGNSIYKPVRYSMDLGGSLALIKHNFEISTNYIFNKKGKETGHQGSIKLKLKV